MKRNFQRNCAMYEYFAFFVKIGLSINSLSIFLKPTPAGAQHRFIRLWWTCPPLVAPPIGVPLKFHHVKCEANFTMAQTISPRGHVAVSCERNRTYSGSPFKPKALGAEHNLPVSLFHNVFNGICTCLLKS